MTNFLVTMPLTIKRAVVAIVLILGLAASAAAGSLDDATAAYNRGDYATALRLIRPLAEQGVARAQNNLGALYDTGQGVPQDYAEAVKWYRLAADQGEAGAQANLGFLYANGQGLPQNYVEAVKWFRLAADQGDAGAQNNLGVMYDNGQGVPQDYVRAHVWFNLSAAQGHQNAIKNRDIVARRMTSEQLAEAQKLAREWKPTKP